MDNRVFIIDKDKTKQFLEDSKKNVIHPEFLKRCLKFTDILNNKKSTIVSTKEALKDIEPINWSEDVLSGKRKVEVKELSKQEIMDAKSRLLYDDDEYLAQLYQGQ